MTNEEIDLTLAMRHFRQHHHVGLLRSQQTAFIMSLYRSLKRGIAEGFPYAGCPMNTVTGLALIVGKKQLPNLGSMSFLQCCKKE